MEFNIEYKLLIAKEEIILLYDLFGFMANGNEKRRHNVDKIMLQN